MRRIRELKSLNEDIENSSVHANFKDCRPLEGGQSLFTNSVIESSRKSTKNPFATKGLKGTTDQ